MSAIVFKTPGLLDLRAITHMGMNSKPNVKSPIGYFGTGLKYAVAVLVRKGIQMSLVTEGTLYTFDCESEDFRGKQFEFIYMHNHSRWNLRRDTELAYTTELGKTWELWQVFRELYSNTLDENGEIYTCDDVHAEWLKAKKDPMFTYIIVSGDEFVQEYHNRTNTFLPDASRNYDGTGYHVEHFGMSSKHIYYRGMRVHDLEKESKFTYNILHQIDLTEDRTAKYPFELERLIREHIITHEDEGMIKAVLRAPEGTFEQRLDFNSYHYKPVGKIFIAAGRDVRSPNPTLKPMLEQFEEKEEPKPLEGPFLKHLFQAIEDANYDLYDRLWNDHFDALQEEVKAIEQVV